MLLKQQGPPPVMGKPRFYRSRVRAMRSMQRSSCITQHAQEPSPWNHAGIFILDPFLLHGGRVSNHLCLALAAAFEGTAAASRASDRRGRKQALSGVATHINPPAGQQGREVLGGSRQKRLSPIPPPRRVTGKSCCSCLHARQPCAESGA
jgi:hypothetical protein